MKTEVCYITLLFFTLELLFCESKPVNTILLYNHFLLASNTTLRHVNLWLGYNIWHREIVYYAAGLSSTLCCKIFGFALFLLHSTANGLSCDILATLLDMEGEMLFPHSLTRGYLHYNCWQLVLSHLFDDLIVYLGLILLNFVALSISRRSLHRGFQIFTLIIWISF